MEVILIAAVAKNMVIGREGKLVFQDTLDMDHFKELTMYHPVIMGRRTFESIPPGFRPLRRRLNIVLTSRQDYNPRGVFIAHSIEEALQQAQKADRLTTQRLDPTQAFVIGGGRVYEQAMPYATWLELTEIHQEFEGDTFFPEIPKGLWEEVQREKHERFDFVTYKRISY